ncbi:MAG: hypothetical protein IKN54_06930 [Lachnospiraceae bacterium]|nr:hypothetical protein [Lachnospiraceae bacterium]
MKKEYIDVVSYDGEGYKPLVDYQTWRCAVLRYIDELELDNLINMQKHNETDELFILLEGECVLFVGGKDDDLSDIDAIKMEPLKIYNVKRGTYHTHTLMPNTTVLIVENRDTDDSNSPRVWFTQEQKDKVVELGKKLFGTE